MHDTDTTGGTGDDRGQTAQDYAIGIAVFVLTIAFVFSYVPTIFGTFDNPVDGAESTQADRAAEYIVRQHAVDGELNTIRLNGSNGVRAALNTTASFEQFVASAGLTNRGAELPYTRINVTLTNNSLYVNSTGGGTDLVDPTPLRIGGEALTYGADYDQRRPAAATSRMVNFSSSDKCDPVCWVVVRVW